MPISQKPVLNGHVPTSPFTPEGLESDPTSPLYEYFDLRTYLDPQVEQRARREHTRVTVKGSEKREELDQEGYLLEIARAQLTGWRLIVPPEEADFDEKRMTAEHDQWWWTYTPENLARFPSNIHAIVVNEVWARNSGLVPTRKLVTLGPTGQEITFRRTDAGVLPRPRVPAGVAAHQ